MLRRKAMHFCEAWDILKKRKVPQTSQEFVDSKQRLRAALRNIKTIKEIGRKNGSRKYMITDLNKQRNEIKAEEESSLTSLTRNKIKTEEESATLPRRNKKKIQSVKLYDDQDSSSGFSFNEKYTEQKKKKMNPRKKRLPLKSARCYDLESGSGLSGAAGEGYCVNCAKPALSLVSIQCNS
ncbi:hypothetical protein TNCV_1498481 [Trichonephila clavipes]|nr:hypothetical protein TNCV_1498481 [Trichonephila clavipes]